MKSRLITILLIGVMPLLLYACFTYRELPVEYDYSYRGKFKKYKTYDFLIQTDIDENLTSTKAITYAIENHMKFLGYKQNNSKPDLLLSFKVYMDSLNFRGYKQPNIIEWAERPSTEITYERQKYDIKKGTLLIQFFDRKQKMSIWQGYATDYYKKVDFNNIKDVNNAVKSILNKYQFFAEDFLKEQNEALSDGS